MVDKPLSVTYEFTVTLTDFVDGPLGLMTKEEAHETLWQALYRCDKHQKFVLDIKEQSNA